jgi:hypothetical protein
MPGYSLSDPRFDSTVQASGAPFAGPPSISATTEPPPAPVPNAPSYGTGDSHRLYTAKTGLGQPVLAGQWDGWTIEVTVDGLSGPEQARLASLLRFRDHDGYLILDPVAPLHTVPAVGSEIVFNGLAIDASSYPSGCPGPNSSGTHTGAGFPVERIGTKAIWCEPEAGVRIEVQPPAPVDAMIEQLRVQRTSVPAPSTTAPAPTTATTATTAPTTVPTTAPVSGPLPTVTIGQWTGREPRTIYFSGDSGDIVTNLTWSRWTADNAVATGRGIT